MADELFKQCSKLHIKNSEHEIVALDDGFDYSQDEKLSLQLVGRILTKKTFEF